LFTPQDIGLQEAGVAETAVEAVLSDKSTSDEQKQLLFDSIVLIGGNTNIPNYKERFYNEVRKMVPSDFDVTVHVPKK
jgi:actin-related protein 6